MFRDWWWELRKRGYGPHYYFLATFDPSGEDRIAEIVREHPVPGIIWATHQLYMDGAHESGYGFGAGGPSGGPVVTAQNELIVSLLQAPELTLTKWEIIGGGGGYEDKILTTGTSSAELLAYLQTQPLPVEKPDFEIVEQVLREVLSEPEMAHLDLFRFEAGEWVCRVIIVFRVAGSKYRLPKKSLGELYDTVDKVRETVCNKCNIPGRGGTCFHHSSIRYENPEDSKYQNNRGEDVYFITHLTGSILQFGYCLYTGHYDHEDEFPIY